MSRANTGIRRRGTSTGSKPVVINEKSDGPAFIGGRGTIWVRDDTPNVLVFRDDAGNDWLLNVSPTLAVEDETIPVVTTGTMNFAGTGVTVAESPPGTALITIGGSASSLNDILTGGNDGDGLDIDNVGGITHNFGIAIGTDAGAAAAGYGDVVIGTSSSSGYFINSNVIVGSNCSTSYFNSVCMGRSSTINTSHTCVCVGSNTSITSASGSIVIGGYCSQSGLYAVCIGDSASIGYGGSGAFGIAIGPLADVQHSYGIVMGPGTTSALGEIVISLNDPATTFTTTLATNTDPIPPGGTVALANATAMLDVRVGATNYKIALFT